MSQASLEPSMDCPPSPGARCPHCDKMFPNETAMVDHMGLEYRLSDWRHHIHCQICKKYFKSHDAMEAHSKRNHPKDQKLDCPACNRRFIRATDMVRHIEQNDCPRIDTKKLDAVREKKLWFAKELQARHFGDYDEEAEAGYMSRNAALRPKAEATVRPYPVQFEVFESENMDVYAYCQNVLQARRIEESSTAAQTAEVSPQEPQPPTSDLPQPISSEKWEKKTSKTEVSLLDDFDPAEIDGLQPSLIDYDEGGSGRRGPWSAFFNPWENDDLIGISTDASSHAPTPTTSMNSTPRARSPVTATVIDPLAAVNIERSSAAAVVERTTDDAPTKTPRVDLPPEGTSVMIAETSEAMMPDKSYGGSVTPAYNPGTLMPLRNYRALTATQAHDFASPPSQNISDPGTNKGSQALTSVETSQALTATRGLGAAAAAQGNIKPLVADFDEVKESFAKFAATHNPENPNFKVQSYWNNIVAKYKCPMPQCFKSFKKPGQFKHHMRTHMEEKKCLYPCPGCKDMFETIAALIAHTESQSIRCRFRHSKNYGIFLSQALAGMLDVVGEDLEHGTVQFAVSKEAKTNFGAISPAKETRRSRSDEFKAATAALEERAIDEQEEKRRFWEEHERQIEAQKAKEREDERVMQTKKEQDKKMEEEKSKEQARTWQTKIEHERQVEEVEAREAEQERIRQAKMLKGRKFKEESTERKSAEQQWVQVKQEPSAIVGDEDMEKLEEEERQLLEKMEKVKEQRWKLLQETETRAVESVRKEQRARQAQNPGQQPGEEQVYTVTDAKKFNWW